MSPADLERMAHVARRVQLPRTSRPEAHAAHASDAIAKGVRVGMRMAVEDAEDPRIARRRDLGCRRSETSRSRSGRRSSKMRKMPIGDWEKANGRSWPHEGRAPVWPQDYPPSCNCNPPSHTPEQINADESFHSRTCPDHPGRRS